MGKFGGKENSPATVYPVKIDDDKKVYVLLEDIVLPSKQQQQKPLISSAARGTRAISKASAWLNIGERPRPMDTNICLSLLDGVLRPGATSKTTELNIVANCVSRAMLYGNKRDKDDISVRLEEMAEVFARYDFLLNAPSSYTLFITFIAK